MESIQKMTGMDSRALSKAGLVMGILFVVFGVGASYVTCLLGVAYPVFMTFLALESDTEGDDKQWLTYWVVFGCCNILDQYASIILHFIPFYFFIKMSFLIWLYHPSTMGATTIYDSYIKDNGKIVDGMLKEGEANLAEASSQAVNKAKSMYGKTE